MTSELSKRHFKRKFGQSNESDSKSLFVNVKSKPNVRDGLEPLDDMAAIRILHNHFSPVFTSEYICTGIADLSHTSRGWFN